MYNVICKAMTLREHVQILDFENVDKLFPADVISRAKEYLAAIPGGTGAYSDSQGAPILREQIAKVFASPVQHCMRPHN
jgi:alanine transaminase